MTIKLISCITYVGKNLVMSSWDWLQTFNFCWVFSQVVLQPVEFVYSETLIKRASSFFSFPASHEVVNDQVRLYDNLYSCCLDIIFFFEHTRLDDNMEVSSYDYITEH